MSVATKFLTHLFDKIFKKSKNSEKQRKSKKYVLLIYLHHLSIFNVISKELKSQRSFERVQLLTRYFQNYWFSLSRGRWYCSFSEKNQIHIFYKTFEKKIRRKKTRTKGGRKIHKESGGQFWKIKGEEP